MDTDVKRKLFIIQNRIINFTVIILIVYIWLKIFGMPLANFSIILYAIIVSILTILTSNLIKLLKLPLLYTKNFELGYTLIVHILILFLLALTLIYCFLSWKYINLPVFTFLAAYLVIIYYYIFKYEVVKSGLKSKRAIINNLLLNKINDNRTFLVDKLETNKVDISASIQASTDDIIIGNNRVKELVKKSSQQSNEKLDKFNETLSENNSLINNKVDKLNEKSISISENICNINDLNSNKHDERDKILSIIENIHTEIQNVLKNKNENTTYKTESLRSQIGSIFDRRKNIANPKSLRRLIDNGESIPTDIVRQIIYAFAPNLGPLFINSKIEKNYKIKKIIKPNPKLTNAVNRLAIKKGENPGNNQYYLIRDNSKQGLGVFTPESVDNLISICLTNIENGTFDYPNFTFGKNKKTNKIPNSSSIFPLLDIPFKS